MFINPEITRESSARELKIYPCPSSTLAQVLQNLKVGNGGTAYLSIYLSSSLFICLSIHLSLTYLRTYHVSYLTHFFLSSPGNSEVQLDLRTTGFHHEHSIQIYNSVVLIQDLVGGLPTLYLSFLLLFPLFPFPLSISSSCTERYWSQTSIKK